MCGAKRPSPSSIPQFGIASNNCEAAEIEPKNKKPMLHADFQFCGCKEIRLSIDFSALMTQQPQQAPPSESDLAAATKSKASPELRRCVSDPIAAPGDDNNDDNGIGDSKSESYETNQSTEAQDTGVKEQEEEVHVEKVGDGMKINLRCPCGSGFQILISGQSCYYKLL